VNSAEPAPTKQTVVTSRAWHGLESSSNISHGS
jgi:hypothetical protein